MCCFSFLFFPLLSLSFMALSKTTRKKVLAHPGLAGYIISWLIPWRVPLYRICSIYRVLVYVVFSSNPKEIDWIVSQSVTSAVFIKQVTMTALISFCWNLRLGSFDHRHQMLSYDKHLKTTKHLIHTSSVRAGKL